MTGPIKAALCAATFLFVPAVHAATIFQFDTVGTGTFFVGDRNGGNPRVFNLSNVSFQYVVGTSLDQSSFITAFGSGGANADGIKFGERGPNITTASIDLCFNNTAGTFNLPNGNAPGFCGGTVSYQSQGNSLPYGSYTGTIVGVSSFQGDAPQTGNGAFSGFVALAVPEPSTWALMLAGFGMVGFTMRRRRASLQMA